MSYHVHIDGGKCISDLFSQCFGSAEKQVSQTAHRSRSTISNKVHPAKPNIATWAPDPTLHTYMVWYDYWYVYGMVRGSSRCLKCLFSIYLSRATFKNDIFHVDSCARDELIRRALVDYVYFNSNNFTPPYLLYHNMSSKRYTCLVFLPTAMTKLQKYL